MANIHMSNNHFNTPGVGTPIEAHCPVHGKFTGWIPIKLAGHSGQISRNSVSCPKCGKASTLAEGSFDFTKEVVHDLHGVKISRQLRRRFEREVVNAKSPSQAVEKAHRIHPILAKFVEQAARAPRWQQVAAGILAITTFLAEAPAALETADAVAEWVYNKILSEDQEVQGVEKSTYEQQADERETKEGSDNEGWNDVTDI